MKKRIIICIIFLLILLTGCGKFAKEKAQEQLCLQQGEENILNYILQKYNFKPEILDIYCLRRYDGFPFSPHPLTGDVRVKLIYNGTAFTALIPGTEATTEGIDNYQYSEIVGAFENAMEKLTNYSSQEIILYYGSGSLGMVNTYFDGFNLQEILDEERFSAVVSYINKDLSQIKIENIQSVLGKSRYLFVSYYSLEDYKNCDNHEYDVHGGSKIEYGINDNALYIKEYRALNWSKDQYVQFDKRNFNGIYYIPDNAEANVKLTEDSIYASFWNRRGFLNARQVMKAYKITTDAREIIFYIPIESLDLSSEESRKYQIVYTCVHDGSTIYGTAITSRTKDNKYLTGIINMRNREDVIVSVLTDMD